MTKAEIEKRMAEIQEQLNKAYETFAPLLKEWSELKTTLESPKQKKTGWEKPERGQWYWYIDHQGKVHSSCWSNQPLDHERYVCCNYFTSKKLAENIARYQSLDLRIRRRIAEICKPVDWKSRTWKSDIVYLHEEGKLVCGDAMTAQSASWCCDTKERAEQIIEEFKDDLLWYFTEFKDRMDG